MKRCHLYRSLGLPVPDEPVLPSFTDAWMVFVFELGSIAPAMRNQFYLELESGLHRLGHLFFVAPLCDTR